MAVSFMLSGILISILMNASGQTAPIPSWIKNTALWWGQGQISDDEFIKAIQWLVDQKIIVLPSNQQTPSPNANVSSASKSSTNSLAIYLPTQDDMGSQWDIQGHQTHSKAFDNAGAKQSIEQTYVKTTTTPNVIATVEIGMFASDSQATAERSSIVKFWDTQNFEKWNYDTHTSYISCSGIVRIVDPNITIDVICIEGLTLTEYEVSGSGIGRADEMSNLITSTLEKIPLDVALQ